MIRLLIACLVTLLVSSCLDSHEEVWINADASGKARVQLSLPTSAVVANGGEKEIRSMIINYFGLFRKICGLKLASERFRSARSSWKLPTTGRFENGSETRRRSGLLWAT
ncbi:MAG: hypothetical protein ACK56K_10530, partial [Akkermansiaceae bacterium]